MSPRRLLGWEPVETHSYLDAEGEPCAAADAFQVVVTREPEWSDLDRDQLLALAQYEAGLCDCGFHRSRMTPGEHHYAIEQERCPVCANVERFKRKQQAADDREVEALPDGAPASLGRASDGRKTIVRRKHPLELLAGENG